jgi:hypothetical protein
MPKETKALLVRLEPRLTLPEYNRRRRALERRIERTSKEFVRWLQIELHISRGAAIRISRVSAEASRESFMPLLDRVRGSH